MNTSKEYNLAVALLRFRTSYQQLVKASKEMSDYDISEEYPFYLLDFEDIEPQVLQWCSTHASALMKQVPLQVPNPACFGCKFFGDVQLPNGLCRGSNEIKCNNYPVIQFTKEAVLPYLMHNVQDLDVDKLDHDTAYILYLENISTKGKQK